MKTAAQITMQLMMLASYGLEFFDIRNLSKIPMLLPKLRKQQQFQNKGGALHGSSAIASCSLIASLCYLCALQV